MSFTGSCYQGPLAGQMLEHTATRKEFFHVDLESKPFGDERDSAPVLIGWYEFDGFDLWKWKPTDDYFKLGLAEAI